MTLSETCQRISFIPEFWMLSSRQCDIALFPRPSFISFDVVEHKRGRKADLAKFWIGGKAYYFEYRRKDKLVLC